MERARRADLQVCIWADDGVLQVAAILHLHAVHQDAVYDLDIAAQLAHGAQHTALYGALVRHSGPPANLITRHKL